jgi:F0F1-type ATP synthase assembly protein I
MTNNNTLEEQSRVTNHNASDNQSNLSFWLPVGIIVGAAFGLIIADLALGISMGMLLGVVIGIISGRQSKG